MGISLSGNSRKTVAVKVAVTFNSKKVGPRWQSNSTLEFMLCDHEGENLVKYNLSFLNWTFVSVSKLHFISMRISCLI